VKSTIDLPTDLRLLRKKEIAHILNVSVSTLQRWRSRGFPKPVQLSPRMVGWLESDIRAWLDKQRGEKS